MLEEVECPSLSVMEAHLEALKNGKHCPLVAEKRTLRRWRR